MSLIIKHFINKLLNLLGYKIVKYHYRYGGGGDIVTIKMILT